MTDTRRAEFVEALDAFWRAVGNRDKFGARIAARAEVLRLYDAATAVQGGEPVPWDRCDACNGTLGDHHSPDQGGCPGFRKTVPLAAAPAPAGKGEAVAYLYADDMAELERVGSARIYQQRQNFTILPHQEPAMAVYLSPPTARQDEGRDAARWRHIKADTSLAWICLMRREPDEWDAEIDAAMSGEAK